MKHEGWVSVAWLTLALLQTQAEAKALPTTRSPQAGPVTHEIPTLDATQLPIEALSDWGTQTYRVLDGASQITSRRETQVGESSVLFRETSESVCKGELIRISIETLHRRDPLLTVVQMTSLVEMEPEEWCDLARGSRTVVNSAVVDRFEQGQYTVELPPGTLTRDLLQLLLAFLPRNVGLSWRIPKLILRSSEWRVHDYLLTCRGTQLTVVEGRPKRLTWYQLTQMEPARRAYPLNFWIDEQGVLIRYGSRPRAVAILVEEGS